MNLYSVIAQVAKGETIEKTAAERFGNVSACQDIRGSLKSLDAVHSVNWLQALCRRSIWLVRFGFIWPPDGDTLHIFSKTRPQRLHTINGDELLNAPHEENMLFSYYMRTAVNFKSRNIRFSTIKYKILQQLTWTQISRSLRPSTQP